MSTLSCDNFTSVTKSLKRLIKKSDRKSYTMYVGRINPAKLSNFLQIDMYVIVSCPEKSLSFNAKDFMKPIITPHELLLALDEDQEFTGQINLKFQELKLGSSTDQKNQGSCNEENKHGGDVMEQSDDILGELQGAQQKKINLDINSQDPQILFTQNSLVQEIKNIKIIHRLKNKDQAIARVFGDEIIERVQARTYKGLDINCMSQFSSQDVEVTPPVEGMTGIASLYQKQNREQ